MNGAGGDRCERATRWLPKAIFLWIALHVCAGGLGFMHSFYYTYDIWSVLLTSAYLIALGILDYLLAFAKNREAVRLIGGYWALSAILSLLYVVVPLALEWVFLLYGMLTPFLPLAVVWYFLAEKLGSIAYYEWPSRLFGALLCLFSLAHWLYCRRLKHHLSKNW